MAKSSVRHFKIRLNKIQIRKIISLRKRTIRRRRKDRKLRHKQARTSARAMKRQNKAPRRRRVHHRKPHFKIEYE